MDISESLKRETEKWLEKLEKEMKKANNTTKNKQIENELVNINAYISDCKHFLEKKDLVKAFEAIIYAWGIVDTLRRCGLIRTSEPTESPDATSDK